MSLFPFGKKPEKKPVIFEKVSISFAIVPDENMGESYKKILTSIQDDLLSLRLSHLFTLNTIETHIDNQEEAQQYLYTNNVHMVIWGLARTAFLHGEEMVELLTRFTFNDRVDYTKPDDLEVGKVIFNKRAEKAIYGSFGSILHPDILPHLIDKAEDPKLISMYLLIRMLISFGHGITAFRLCEQLLDQLKSESSSSLKAYVINIAVECARLLSLHFFSKENNMEQADYYSIKALELDPTNYEALISYSTICWIKGEKDKALELIKRAGKSNPSSNIVKFNQALFLLDQGSYQEAVEAYDSIHRIPEEINFQYISSFLTDEARKMKKPAFLFGAGYLETRFGDCKKGTSQLKQFDKMAKGKPEYRALLNRAEDLIRTSA